MLDRRLLVPRGPTLKLEGTECRARAWCVEWYDRWDAERRDDDDTIEDLPSNQPMLSFY